MHFCLFVLLLYIPVNSYGHGGTVYYTLLIKGPVKVHLPVLKCSAKLWGINGQTEVKFTLVKNLNLWSPSNT